MKQSRMIGMIPFYLLTAILLIGAANWGSRAVSAYAQMKPVERTWKVIIDAGHGGIDGGATSCTGVLESRINLEIGKRLRDLMHLIGYETVMIRDTDTSIYTQGNTIAAQKMSDLKERVRIVNETENALLISIHQNTFSDSKYSGAQVFYADTPGSKDLAQSLQSAVVRELEQKQNRKSKPAQGVYLMRNINKTGVLIECGFLSNPVEEAMLRSSDYQQKICCVIACTVSSYLNKA